MPDYCEYIDGTIVATLDDDGLRAVCDHLENRCAGDSDADRDELIDALYETITATVGENPWGGCTASLADDEDGTVSVTFRPDNPSGVVEVCEMLAHWFVGKVVFSGDDGPMRLDVGYGYAHPVRDVTLVGKRDQLWLAQLTQEDGSNFVHVCRSREDAYTTLAAQAGLQVADGVTAEQAVDDHFGDSEQTSYLIAPVDSTDL